MVTLLNTSILTAFGAYRYEPLALEEARRLVADGFVSAIGHESTARMLSELLGVAVAVRRDDYQQQVGEQAIVFKLKRRTPEGAILTAEEIQAIGYEFGLLTRTE
jgi:STIV B116-like